MLVLRWVEPSSTAFMRAFSEESGEIANYDWTDYSRISENVKRAVIAAEDTRFMDHAGFDWHAIKNAASRNVREGRISAGGSTITQQLAKNLFFSGDKTFVRKLNESVVAVMLECFLSKKRIFELYLNVIEWGQGIYGVNQAARHYFDLPPSRLNPEQAARLASYIPAPRVFYFRGDTVKSLGKTNDIRGRMSQSRFP